MTKNSTAKKVKVLLLEDDPYRCNILKNHFDKEGFDLKFFLDSKMVVENTIKEKPDIILSNVVLPYLDGYEVIELLKENNVFTLSVLPQGST